MKIDTGSRGERKSRGSERTTRHPRGKPASVGVDPIVIVPPRLKRGSIWAASNEETRRDRGGAGQAENAAAAKQTTVMARAGPNSVGLCAGVNGNLSFDILLSLSLFRGPTKPSKAAFESLRETAGFCATAP